MKFIINTVITIAVAAAPFVCFSLQSEEGASQSTLKKELEKLKVSLVQQRDQDAQKYQRQRDELLKQGVAEKDVDREIKRREEEEEMKKEREAHKEYEERFGNSKFYKRLKNGDLSPSTPLKEWTANSGTNEVCVTICTDSIQFGRSIVLAFREFRFSADGRLLAISPVREIRRDGRNPTHNRE